MSNNNNNNSIVKFFCEIHGWTTEEEKDCRFCKEAKESKKASLQMANYASRGWINTTEKDN